MVKTPGRYACRILLSLFASLLMLTACDSRVPSPDEGRGTATPVPADEAVIPSPTSQVATEDVPATLPAEEPTPAESSAATPAAEPDRQSATPSDEGLAAAVMQIFVDSLGYDPAQQAPNQPGIVDVTVFELDTPADQPRAWVAHTVGLRDFTTNQPHVLAVYQLAGAGSVAEAARVSMDGLPAGTSDAIAPDYVDASGVTQIAVEPAGIWLGVEAGIGAHGGAFSLYRFAGGSLVLELSAYGASPGLASAADLNGDGLLEVLIDAGDPYVFCYACGIRIPQTVIWRWDGTQMVQVGLQKLPAGARADHVALNEELLTFAEAGLWGKVNETLAVLDSLQAAQDAPLPEDLVWNMAVARQNEQAKRAPLLGEGSPYPLLEHIFYGDYAGAVSLMRAYHAAEIFAPVSPLIAGTVAEGWEASLAGWILRSTDAALEVQPASADIFFLRGWASWLLGDNAAARLALDEAAALAPDDALFVEAALLLRALAAPGGEFAAPAGLIVYSGPGEEWPAAGEPPAGTLITATGRLATGGWIQVQVAPDVSGKGAADGWTPLLPGLLPDAALETLPTVAAPPFVAPVVARGRIFYSAPNEGGLSAIWSIDVVAGAQALLVIDEARQPAVQSQAQVLAFASTRADMLGLGGLDLRTSERLRFTLNVEDALPRWFAGGDRLIFSSTREGDRRPRIYRVWSDDAASAESLLFGRDADPRPVDGMIVFKGCDETGSGCGLWMANGEGAERSPLTANPGDARPRWSPNGDSVVFMSDGRDGNWELYLLTLADLSVLRLTANDGPDGLPAFSPDGKSLAWMAQRDGLWQLLTLTLGESSAPTASPATLILLGSDVPNWLEHGLDWVP